MAWLIGDKSFFLGNEYQDTTIFLVQMQQSPSFYTVNIGQFLLQSKKNSLKMRAKLVFEKHNRCYQEHCMPGT